MIEKFGLINVVLIYSHYPSMNKITWPINLDRMNPEDLLESVLYKFAFYKNKYGERLANKNNLYGVFIYKFLNSRGEGLPNSDKISKLEAVVLNNEDERFERYLKKYKKRILRFLKDNGIKY